MQTNLAKCNEELFKERQVSGRMTWRARIMWEFIMGDHREDFFRFFPPAEDWDWDKQRWSSK